MNLSLMQNSRSRTLVFILLIVGAVFVSRLFYLQVMQHAYYEAEALKEHTQKFAIPAKRGLVYAKDGSEKTVPLVLNEPVFIAFADPRYVKDSQKTADTIRRIAGGNTVQGFDEQLRDKNKQYTVIAKQLNKQQAELIKKEQLPGIGLQESERRVYPEGQLAAQLLGYVNADGTGQYGLEGMLNDRLAGSPGMLKAVTDVHGIPLSLSDKDVSQPARNGDNLVLNVDRNIQGYVEQALKTGLEKAQAKHGSVIVMDPMSGGVMAMANFPTYDPGKYFEVQDFAAFQNKVVSDPYEPGSVMKTLTMGAGLDKGVVKPDSTYSNTGSTTVDDALIKNAVRDQLGTTSMGQVLQFSLNTGVVHVLRQLGGGGEDINRQGRDTLYDYFYNHYMLGKKTGIEQAGEVPGSVISPEEQQGNAVRYANMTFGQGMDLTMVQVAAGFSAAINGGMYYQPQLVAGTLTEDGKLIKQAPKIVRDNVISRSASSDLQHMMIEARNKSSLKAGDKKGYRIGTKSGTSQTIDPKTGKYTDDNSIGSYLGFGGDETPRYVIMVRVVDSKLPGYAGTVAAAPIFTDISNWMLDYLKVQPK